MKKLTKLTALLLAILMIALVGAAYAESTAKLGDDEDGVAGKWQEKDTPIAQATSINIKKEITAYNVNGTAVHAPVVTYTYTVTPATVDGKTVTDEDDDHASGTAVTAPVNAGVTTGLTVNGGTAGNATSATGTLEFDNSKTFNTAAAGETNEYDITLDFSDITFTQPGVYRYQIVETIAAGTADEDDYDKVYDIIETGILNEYAERLPDALDDYLKAAFINPANIY